MLPTPLAGLGSPLRPPRTSTLGPSSDCKSSFYLLCIYTSLRPPWPHLWLKKSSKLSVEWQKMSTSVKRTVKFVNRIWAAHVTVHFSFFLIIIFDSKNALKGYFVILHTKKKNGKFNRAYGKFVQIYLVFKCLPQLNFVEKIM